MRRAPALVALIAVVASLAPGGQAAVAPEFPPSLLALLPAWMADAEALAANDTGKDWYPEAKRFLDSAKEAQADGRFRSAIFDLETFHELVLTGQLIEQGASLPSDAERKSVILQRTAQWHAEAGHAWTAYRDQLYATEGDIRSVRGMELALYSAEQAIGGRLLLDERELVAREFPKQPGVERAYVLALVRASHTSLLDIQWAQDILSVVTEHEGLPPRLNETVWRDAGNISLQPLIGTVPAHLQPLEKIADEARTRNETTLAIAVNLAEQRASRATNIFIIYGDATSRRNVTGDATAAMGKQLDNLTMDPPREYGLLGVFTADAIDRGVKTREYALQGQAELGIIIAAWAALDHQGYVTATLGAASPIQPASVDPDPAETPLGWLVALAALGVVALARRR